MRFRVVALGCAWIACTPQPSTSPTTDAAPQTSGDASTSTIAASVDAGDASAEPATPPAPEEKEATFSEILDILFADRASTASVTTACPASLPPEARIRCLYDERYKGDPKAAGLAHEMLVKWKIVAGVEVSHTMDGGYRGMIKLEPTVPINDDRKHLEWASAAFRDFDQFFGELDKFGREHDAGSANKPYRFRGINYRFARSVNVNRPSAYAHDWTIGYNVRGSINLNADMVRETLFHEIFHLNDPVHGDGRWWSDLTLKTAFDAIVKKCGVNSTCLAPYTPNETMVRGGTYYSFQPGNGVVEYAAELALRYYREQRASLRSLPKRANDKPFKCGPQENKDSWEAMKNEFFRGIDATPPCP